MAQVLRLPSACLILSVLSACVLVIEGRPRSLRSLGHEGPLTTASRSDRQLWIDPKAQPTNEKGWNVILSIVCSGQYNTVGAIYVRTALGELGFPSDPSRMAFGGNAAMAGFRFTASFTVNLASARSEKDALDRVAVISPEYIIASTAAQGQQVNVLSVFASAYEPNPGLNNGNNDPSSPPPPPPKRVASPPPPPPMDPTEPVLSPSPRPVRSPRPPTPPSDPWVPVSDNNFASPPPPSPSRASASPVPPPRSPRRLPQASPLPPAAPGTPVAPQPPSKAGNNTPVVTAIFVQAPMSSVLVNSLTVQSTLCPALRAALALELDIIDAPFSFVGTTASGCSSITYTADGEDVYYKTLLTVPQYAQRLLGRVLVGAKETQARFLSNAKIVCNSRVVLQDVASGVYRASVSPANSAFMGPEGGCRW